MDEKSVSYLLNLPVLVKTLFYTVVFILTYIQLKCASSTGINDYLRTYLLAILQIVLVQTTSEELNMHSVPQTAATTFVFSSVFIPFFYTIIKGAQSL